MRKESFKIAVSGWEMLSAFGIGKQAFNKAICSPVASQTTLAGSTTHDPALLQSHPIPGFDIKQQLGRKGTRSLDRQTALSIVTTKMAIDDCDPDFSFLSEQAGMAHCTTTGSIKSITDFTRDTFVQDRPYLVDPGRFPNTVLNCAAGQCAIWHKLKGPNATLSGGHTSFYSALGFARRWIKNSYAKVVLAGAVEEVSEQTVWGLKRLNTHKQRADLPLAETCAMFVLHSQQDPDKPKTVAHILSAGVRSYHQKASRAGGLSQLISHCLHQAGIEAKKIDLVCTRRSGKTEMAAMDMALGAEKPAEILAIEERMGETYTALGAVQLAALCARFEARETTSGYGLATAIGPNGSVACMVVEKGAQS